MKIFLISAIVFFVDQLTKLLTKKFMMLRDSIPVIGDFLRLTYIENDGMAFGISIGNKLLFNAFSVIAAGVIFYYLVRLHRNHFLSRFALAIIFGGAIGNLLDRILYGRVVDFIDVNIPNIPDINLYFFTIPAMSRWPIFNVADIAVSLGMFLLFLTVFTSKSPWHENDSEPEPEHQPVESDERG